MNPNGVNRAGLWLSIVVSIVLLLGAIGSTFFIAFKTTANSGDIQALSMRMSVIEESNRQSQLKITEQSLALNEIETQFAAQDIIHNLTRASEMRIDSLLWQKVYGTNLPTDNAYYPTISNRKN